ncbi:helix-turn-helix transcriptional regulator [Pseudomonas sp. Q1-7]|uniref:helix-turn-helix transcriptional regulator n=1 Tax=Pseudomonas sp. Q1-7 TaxID=3020843 RepID=UPI00230158F8|nr:response regulator transcription factor [Pseudomonas sp. Q1-7]
MAKISVFIAAGINASWSELLLLLGEEDDLSVLGLATGEHAIQLAEKVLSDVLLLDESLIAADPVALLGAFSAHSTTRILIFNGQSLDGVALLQLVPMGVRGLLSAGHELRLLAKAVRVVSCGGLWLERRTLEISLLQEGASRALMQTNKPTPRESEIIACIRRGMSNKETARHLGISDKTVKVHLNHIYGKLGVSRR